MTRRNEEIPEIVRKLVIFTDICSSTAILEDLKASDNQRSWLNVLIYIKENLIHCGSKIGIEMYKFVGDGWILLAPHDISQKALFDFLDNLFYFLDIGLGEEKVRELLSRQPKPMGWTIGIDSGDLIKLEMNEQVEYVGRPLNVAARLQGAAKQFIKDKDYVVSGLISKSAFAQTRGKLDPDVVKLEPVRISLKHISGGQEIDCWHW